MASAQKQTARQTRAAPDPQETAHLAADQAESSNDRPVKAAPVTPPAPSKAFTDWASI